MKIKKLYLFLICLFTLIFGFRPETKGMELIALKPEALQTRQVPQELSPEESVHLFQQLNKPQITEGLKREHNLTDPHSVIKQEVDDALKTCNINPDGIIVLQDENSTNSCVAPLKGGLKLFKVGVSDARGGSTPLPLIRESIYHECGHIVHNDVGLNKPRLITTVLTVYGASLYAAAKFNNATASYLPMFPRYAGSIATGIASLFVIGPTYGDFLLCRQETRADAFAAAKLIHVKKDFTPCILRFIDRCAAVDENHKVWDGYPDNHTRARIMLKELKKAKVDFNHLPVKQEDLEGTGFTPQKVQELFDAKLAKHFPEYIKNK